MKTWTATVAHAEAGTRLDRWLAGRLPDLSRTRLRALIESGQVRVGGHAVKAAHRLRASERVEVLIPPGRRGHPRAPNSPPEFPRADHLARPGQPVLLAPGGPAAWRLPHRSPPAIVDPPRTGGGSPHDVFTIARTGRIGRAAPEAARAPSRHHPHHLRRSPRRRPGRRPEPGRPGGPVVIVVGSRRVAAGAEVNHRVATREQTASRACPGPVISRAIRAANPSARAGDRCYADRFSPRTQFQ